LDGKNVGRQERWTARTLDGKKWRTAYWVAELLMLAIASTGHERPDAIPKKVPWSVGTLGMAAG
jgi:hypothetical protein